MSGQVASIFFSYARTDAGFVLDVAKALRKDGVRVWIDQLDIPSGARWDESVETAMRKCSCLVVIMSPASVRSQNVMDEVAYALEEQKTVVPVLLAKCVIPFRLKRIQFIDFTDGYETGYQQLLATVRRLQQAEADDATTVLPDAGKRRSPEKAAEAPVPNHDVADPEDTAPPWLRRRAGPARARPVPAPRVAKSPAATSHGARNTGDREAGVPVKEATPSSLAPPGPRIGAMAGSRQSATESQVAATPVAAPAPTPSGREASAAPNEATPAPLTPPGPRLVWVSGPRVPAANSHTAAAHVAAPAPPPTRPPAAGPISPAIAKPGPAVQSAVQRADLGPGRPEPHAAHNGPGPRGLAMRRDPAAPAPGHAEPGGAPVARGRGPSSPAQGPSAPGRAELAPTRTPAAPPAAFPAGPRMLGPALSERDSGGAPRDISASPSVGAASRLEPFVGPRKPPPPPEAAAPAAGNHPGLRVVKPTADDGRAPQARQGVMPAGARPDTPAGAPEPPRQPPPAAAPPHWRLDERIDEPVFTFEPEPAAETPDAIADREPVSTEPVARRRRVGWLVTLGVAGVVGATLAAYWFGPWRGHADTALASRAPAPVAPIVPVPKDIGVVAPQRLPELGISKLPEIDRQRQVATITTDSQVQAEKPGLAAKADARRDRDKEKLASATASAGKAGSEERAKAAAASNAASATASAGKAGSEERAKAAAASNAQRGSSASGQTGDEEDVLSAGAVQSLVRRYVAAQDSGDIDAMLALYDERVDFNENRIASHERIREYRERFSQAWPKVSTALSGDIEIKQVDATTADVAFTMVVHVLDPPLPNYAKTRMQWKVRAANGAARVVAERQTVLAAPS